MNFVYISTNPWDEYWWRTDLCNALSELGHNVYYFSIVRPKTYLKYCWQSTDTLSTVKARYIIRISRKLFKNEINRISTTLSDEKLLNSDTVILSHLPEYCMALKEKFGDKVVIGYDLYDRYSTYGCETEEQVSSFDKRENEIIAALDFTLCASYSLTQSSLAYNKKSFWFPNAVDLERFTAKTCTDKSKKLGMTLNNYKRADWPLIISIAKALPDYSFELIGTKDQVPPQLPSNIHLLERMPYDSLWKRVKTWDVGLAVFSLDNRQNEFCCPVKYFEYSACGLPVISNSVPEAAALAEKYPENILVADTAEEYKRLIEKFYPEKNDYTRLARENTWDIRAKELENLVHSL